MLELQNRYISWKWLAMVVVETAGLLCFMVAGHILRSGVTLASHFQNRSMLLQDLILVGVIQICFYLADLYEYQAFSDRKILLFRCCGAIAVAALVYTVLFTVLPDYFRSRGIFFIALVIAAVFAIVTRVLALRLFSLYFLQERVLILGTGEQAKACARTLLDRKDLGFHVEGFLGTNRKLIGKSLVNPKVVGTIGDLEYYTRLHGIRRIVVAMEERRDSLPLTELLNLRFQGLQIDDYHSLYERISGRIQIHHLHPGWLVFGDMNRRNNLFLGLKRVFDIMASLTCLFLTFPILILAAVAIKLDSRGPVFYVQNRVGANSRVFPLLKLRTMKVNAEADSGPTFAQPSDSRVTRVGMVLRRTRLDELPQCINILLGHMSFVGPRPERPEFVETLEQEIPFYRLRHCVKPGLTGWAQVNFRYCSSREDMEDKLQLDLYYIKNISLWMDFIIVLKTIKTVLLARGSR